MELYIYKSEEEQIYDSKYHGHFNKRLAEWAISNMMLENPATGDLERVKRKTLDEYDAMLKANNVKIAEESYYDGYYLLNMALADYAKSLEDDKHRALYIHETINDPDCDPTAVLACFVAKMNVMHIPIYWEKFL